MVDNGCTVIAPKRKRQFKHFHLYLKNWNGAFCHCHASQNRLHSDAQKGCSYPLPAGELQSRLTGIRYNVTILIRKTTLGLVYHAR